MDNVEKREENLKPVKLFSLTVFIYDDGVLSGYGVEYRNMGRLKNQKLIVPGKEEFLSCVRSIVPTAIPTIESVVELLYGDLGVEDSEGSEKMARIVIDIYNDGFIDGDFSEFVKGNRGAPKAWRLSPQEFNTVLNARVGNLSTQFKGLIGGMGTPGTVITATSIDDELTDITEEEEE